MLCFPNNSLISKVANYQYQNKIKDTIYWPYQFWEGKARRPASLNASHIISSCSTMPKRHKVAASVPNTCHNNFPVLFCLKKSCKKLTAHFNNINIYAFLSEVFKVHDLYNDKVTTFGCIYNQNRTRGQRGYCTILAHIQSSKGSQHWKIIIPN